MNTDLPEILRQLRRCSSRPMEEAVGLPVAAYTSEAMYELERDRLFLAGWNCVGRIDQIAGVGDYITYSICDNPVYTINVGDGEYRSFRNVCLHRGALLLDGCGTSRRVACPYHAWTYDSCSGQLIGARYMEESRGFDKRQEKLRQLRTEVWNGWLYVSLSADAAPPSERLSGLDEILGNYGLDSYQTIACEDHVWEANWKILAENFLDEYHPGVVHRATLREYMESDAHYDVMYHEGNVDAWTVHSIEHVGDDVAANAVKIFPELTEQEARYGKLIGIYPSHLISVMPGGSMFWLLLQPERASRVRVRYGVSVPPGYLELTGETSEQVKAIYDTVNDEDRRIVESVARGVRSTDLALGRLSRREWSVWEFQRYLSHRLNGGH